MPDPALIALASAGTAAIAIAAQAALKGWQDWLALKRLELTVSRTSPRPAASGLEVMELKERLRRLEAIANGD